MPSIIRTRPINVISQNIPPRRNIHPACRRFRLLPNIIHAYTEDAHAAQIIPIRRTIPSNNSVHLFMILFAKFYLKGFW